MPSVELVDLQKLGGVLKDAADAIARLGDSVAHLVRLGVQGYDAAAARRTRARLIEIRKGLVSMARSQGVLALTFDSYVARIEAGRQPNAREWQSATAKLPLLVESVQSLLGELRRDRSEFVLEEAYERLHATLGARLALFERLRAAEAPRRPEEIEAIKAAVAEWSRLREELDRASAALAAYLKEA
jgi:hypothetical protein